MCDCQGCFLLKAMYHILTNTFRRNTGTSATINGDIPPSSRRGVSSQPFLSTKGIAILALAQSTMPPDYHSRRIQFQHIIISFNHVFLSISSWMLRPCSITATSPITTSRSWARVIAVYSKFLLSICPWLGSIITMTALA